MSDIMWCWVDPLPMSGCAMSEAQEDQKRKRDRKSSSASDSSFLSIKRIKQALSISSSSAEDSVILEGDSITGQCLPGEPFSPPDPTDTSTPEPKPPTVFPPASCTPTKTDTMSAAELEVMMERVLDRKFLQWKKDIVTDLMGMVNPQIETLEGDIFDLREENKTLKERIDKLEREKEVERENIVSAKVRSVENDQYARRYNMVVFGIAESRNDNAETKIKEIIKEKLKITLKPDAIEICHRLGEKTLNKIRPVIVKFRFRDDKWDVMKARRALRDIFCWGHVSGTPGPSKGCSKSCWSPSLLVLERENNSKRSEG